MKGDEDTLSIEEQIGFEQRGVTAKCLAICDEVKTKNRLKYPNKTPVEINKVSRNRKVVFFPNHID